MISMNFVMNKVKLAFYIEINNLSTVMTICELNYVSKMNVLNIKIFELIENFGTRLFRQSIFFPIFCNQT